MLRLPAPSGVDFILRPWTPERQSGVRHTNHPAHSLRPCIEISVEEKASNKRCHFILPHVHKNQAVAVMPERRLIETSITGKKCGIPLALQENQNLLIL